MDTAVVVRAGNLVFAARSLSQGLRPPELSHEQHLNQRLFKEIEKNLSDGSEATSFPTSTALNCCVTTKRLPAFHVLLTFRAFCVQESLRDDISKLSGIDSNVVKVLYFKNVGYLV